jgi:hypothetical protein
LQSPPAAGAATAEGVVGELACPWAPLHMPCCRRHNDSTYEALPTLRAVRHLDSGCRQAQHVRTITARDPGGSDAGGHR